MSLPSWVSLSSTSHAQGLSWRLLGPLPLGFCWLRLIGSAEARPQHGTAFCWIEQHVLRTCILAPSGRAKWAWTLCICWSLLCGWQPDPWCKERTLQRPELPRSLPGSPAFLPHCRQQKDLTSQRKEGLNWIELNLKAAPARKKAILICKSH